MTEILVIGAGVVGASVAYRLAQAGAAVTILEAGTVAGGTSSATFAWTNANNKPPRAYHDLNVGGMRAHAALREEFGDTPWLHGGGSLEWATDEAHRAELRQRIERLCAWEYAAEEISARRFSELEPDVDPAVVADATIAYFPEEGWIDPVVYAHALIQAAARAGARLHTGSRVRALRRDGDRVVGVTTADGRAHDADVVVNCAGRWASEVAAAAGLDIPLAPTVGLLVLTPPVPARVQHLLRAPECHLRPDGAGRLVIASHEVDDALTAETRPGPSLRRPPSSWRAPPACCRASPGRGRRRSASGSVRSRRTATRPSGRFPGSPDTTSSSRTAASRWRRTSARSWRTRSCEAARTCASRRSVRRGFSPDGPRVRGRRGPPAGVACVVGTIAARRIRPAGAQRRSARWVSGSS